MAISLIKAGAQPVSPATDAWAEPLPVMVINLADQPKFR
jgi:hypothetical protein